MLYNETIWQLTQKLRVFIHKDKGGHETQVGHIGARQVITQEEADRDRRAEGAWNETGRETENQITEGKYKCQQNMTLSARTGRDTFNSSASKSQFLPLLGYVEDLI